MNVHKYHILLDKIWFWCINNCNFANLNWYNDVIALATLFGLISFLLWSVTNYWSYFLLITPERLRNIFLYAYCQYFLPLPTEYFTYSKYFILLKKLTSCPLACLVILSVGISLWRYYWEYYKTSQLPLFVRNYCTLFSIFCNLLRTPLAPLTIKHKKFSLMTSKENFIQNDRIYLEWFKIAEIKDSTFFKLKNSFIVDVS